jgi:hypothetical protein
VRPREIGKVHAEIRRDPLHALHQMIGYLLSSALLALRVMAADI